MISAGILFSYYDCDIDSSGEIFLRRNIFSIWIFNYFRQVIPAGKISIMKLHDQSYK